MPLNRKGGPWEGGYISVGAGGRETFIIEREVGGLRFHVSTRCHIRRAAIKQLERFEADPSAYRPEGKAEEKLVLTNTLVEQYGKFLLERRKTTDMHAKEMQSLLYDWMEDLGSKDLRFLNLRDDIKPPIERRAKNRQHRIIALKAFFGWLRKEKGLMRSAEDATLDLPVPQAVPERRKRRKAVEWSRVQAALAQLPPRYADVLTLLAATGMHVTELQRFVRRDDSELILLPAGAKHLAVLVTKHKSGDYTRIPLQHADHVAAATRLRESRTIPRHLNMELRAACIRAEAADKTGKLKCPPFTLGVMRHSVATWAIDDGADPATVAQFLGHKDPRTTLRFYADANVPTAAIPPRQLRLVKS